MQKAWASHEITKRCNGQVHMQKAWASHEIIKRCNGQVHT
jgi:hypothetical protein